MKNPINITKVKQIILDKNLTKEKICQKACFTLNTLEKILNPNNSNYNITAFLNLCEVLGVLPEDVLEA